MARVLSLVLLLATLSSILPPSASQAATRCEYPRHAGHGYKHPVGVRKVVVDAGGAGDFTSIQQAVDSVPVNNTVRVIMQINAGTYREKVLVPASKPYITFQGAGRDVTVVEWHDRASDRGPDGQPLRTYNTASVTVLSNYFTAKNISFKNTAPAPMPGTQGGQAVAFRISGDKAFFFGCGFHGAQDTLCDDAGRHYFRDCYIEGSIDFVFGDARSLYKDCELRSTAERYGSSGGARILELGEQLKLSSGFALDGKVNGGDKEESAGEASPNAADSDQSEHNLPDSPFASPTKSAAFMHENFPSAETENAASRVGVDSGGNADGGGGNHLRPPTLDIPSPRPYFFPMHRLSSDHGAMGM